MKKSLYVFVALVALFAMVAAPMFAQGGGEASSPKIGFIGPMTGDNANYGVLSNNSAILAVRAVQCQGWLRRETSCCLGH